MEVAVGTYENLILGFTVKPSLTNDRDEFSTRFTDNEHTGAVRCAAISAKHVLATGSSDSCIKLLNLKKGVEIGKLMYHEDSVTCLEFYGTRHMLSASDDGLIVVWNTGRSWECQRVLRGHKGPVFGIAIHPSGKLALSCSKDKTLRTWNLMTGKCAFVTNLKEVADMVKWSPDGKYYLVVIGCRLCFYSASTAAVEFEITSKLKICSLAFIMMDIVAVGVEGGTIQFYSLSTHSLLHEINTSTVRVKDMVVLPSETEEVNTTLARLIMASSDGFIKIYSLKVENTAKAHLITSSLLAETSTGFRLLCAAATDLDIKPSPQDLIVAEEKPVVSGNTARKGGRSVGRVIIEEGESDSALDGESDDEGAVLIAKPIKKKTPKMKKSQLGTDGEHASKVNKLKQKNVEPKSGKDTKKKSDKNGDLQPKKDNKKLLTESPLDFSFNNDSNSDDHEGDDNDDSDINFSDDFDDEDAFKLDNDSENDAEDDLDSDEENSSEIDDDSEDDDSENDSEKDDSENDFESDDDSESGGSNSDEVDEEEMKYFQAISKGKRQKKFQDLFADADNYNLSDDDNDMNSNDDDDEESELFTKGRKRAGGRIAQSIQSKKMKEVSTNKVKNKRQHTQPVKQSDKKQMRQQNKNIQLSRKSEMDDTQQNKQDKQQNRQTKQAGQKNTKKAQPSNTQDKQKTRQIEQKNKKQDMQNRSLSVGKKHKRAK